MQKIEGTQREINHVLVKLKYEYMKSIAGETYRGFKGSNTE